MPPISAPEPKVARASWRTGPDYAALVFALLFIGAVAFAAAWIK